MLACICCGTLEIAVCVAATTIVPAVLAVASDIRRRPLDKSNERDEDANKSETTAVPA